MVLAMSRGRDDLGVVGLGHLRQAGHAALHVGDHHLDRAGDDGQFLLQEVAGDRDAVADQDFVGGAADAGQGDALGAGGLGLGEDLRDRCDAAASISDSAGSCPCTMTLTVFAPSTPRLALLRTGDGRAEEDVRDHRGDPRAAPAVGQRGAEGVQQEVAVVVVDAHVRAVQALDDHAVDALRARCPGSSRRPGASAGRAAASRASLPGG